MENNVGQRKLLYTIMSAIKPLIYEALALMISKTYTHE